MNTQVIIVILAAIIQCLATIIKVIAKFGLKAAVVAV